MNKQGITNSMAKSGCNFALVSVNLPPALYWTLLDIPCLFMQYKKILMVWVRILRRLQPRVIQTQAIYIFRIA